MTLPLVASRAGQEPGSTAEARFWRRHALWPGLAFAGLALVFATTGLDESLARAWAFDPVAGRFIGAGPGEWWAKGLLHADGGLLVRVLGGLVLAFWLATFFVDRLKRWRRPAGYLVLSIAVGAGLVGGLKQVTNIDCPWSLAGFGGQNPYVHLFGDRPDQLSLAHCFPGGHSSSGFALFSLYFLLLFRHRRAAKVALFVALLVGGVFAFGQEARGAHFLSHDLWSAALMWFVCLGIFVFGYRGEVWSTPGRDSSRIPGHGGARDPADGQSPVAEIGAARAAVRYARVARTHPGPSGHDAGSGWRGPRRAADRRGSRRGDLRLRP